MGHDAECFPAIFTQGTEESGVERHRFLYTACHLDQRCRETSGDFGVIQATATCATTLLAGIPFTSSGQPVNIENGQQSYSINQPVHIDASKPFTSTRVNGLVVQLVHIENCTLSARKNAPSAGEKGKKKALISQDFFVWWSVLDSNQ